jgi:MurNAc alpha-1-phosphate uridylyltransferase
VKAMILAAGLGQRMRPLTDHLPKPLLPLAGKPLIEYHLESLARLGVKQLVINLAYLGYLIRAHVGDGSRWGLEVNYSEEPEPLETGGGISRALPLLGSEPFLLVNADVWTDWPFERWRERQLVDGQLGHLLLVPNPEFHPQGDFGLNASGLVADEETVPRYTFAGISLLHPDLVASYPRKREKFPLAEALRWAIAQRRISGEVHKGGWSDVGTPARLAALEEYLIRSPC